MPLIGSSSEDRPEAWIRSMVLGACIGATISHRRRRPAVYWMDGPRSSKIGCRGNGVVHLNMMQNMALLHAIMRRERSK